MSTNGGQAIERTEVQVALAALTSVAAELGLGAVDATVIQNSNRLAVRLEPCDVLARVAPAVGRNYESAQFEIEVARRLQETDSPVAELEPRVQPLVYERNGFAITLWKYYQPLPGEIPPDEYARSLERLHAGMRQVGLKAPRFTDRVTEALSVVQDPALSPDLADADRELLRNTLLGLERAITQRRAKEQLLHGEPHPGNLLRTAAGPRFIDLQTCCYGPVEFDLAHAPEAVDDHYPDADRLLLRDCRILTLAMVAAWRSDRDDQFPGGLQQRAEFLRLIRTALDRYGIDVPR